MPPVVVAPRHLRIGIDQFEPNIVGWIATAIGVATRANPGNLGLGVLFGGAGAADPDTALVEAWFGDLDQAQVTTLRDNLTLMRTVLTHPQASVRIVDAPMIPHDRAYYAQVRGQYNALRPVLSIEVADQWPGANLDTKVNTLFHELSHRILGTVDLGPADGYPQMMYGVANAQHLATAAPDDALRNAENYGYFVALSNGLVNQAP